MVGKIICPDHYWYMVPCTGMVINKLALQFHARSMIFGHMLAITWKGEGGKKRGGGQREEAEFFPCAHGK